MSHFTIWHNSRCSKSRQTLALLRERGIEPTERFYLEDAPSADELRAVLALLGLQPIEITRTGESLFRELGLQKTDTDAVILQALADNPKLIERPIVIKNDTAAVIGRPPENALILL